MEESISVDDEVNSVYKALKLPNGPYLVAECLASEIDEFGSVKSSLSSKPSSEGIDYSSGSSFEEMRNTVDAIVKRTDENPHIAPLSGDTENVKLVSLACLLQKERDSYGFELKQESQTQELIPLEEFNRRYCSLNSSDSMNKGVDQAGSDINRCHPPSTVHCFVENNVGLGRADQDALAEPNPSTSAANTEFLKGGIKADSTRSLSPSFTYDTKEIHELKQPSARSSGSASSPWRASFDHPGTLDTSVVGSSSFAHQSLYSGQMHSGNMSIRSESSTTSTRSFAFPVLQSEWNSSPVRIATVDRRFKRSQRWWVPRITCCKF